MLAGIDIFRVGLQVLHEASGCGRWFFSGRARVCNLPLEADVFVIVDERNSGAFALFGEHLIGGKVSDALGRSVGEFGAREMTGDFLKGTASGFAIASEIQMPIGGTVKGEDDVTRTVAFVGEDFIHATLGL